jgi:hypothetical protein
LGNLPWPGRAGRPGSARQAPRAAGPLPQRPTGCEATGSLAPARSRARARSPGPALCLSLNHSPSAPWDMPRNCEARSTPPAWRSATRRSVAISISCRDEAQRATTQSRSRGVSDTGEDSAVIGSAAHSSAIRGSSFARPPSAGTCWSVTGDRPRLRAVWRESIAVSRSVDRGPPGAPRWRARAKGCSPRLRPLREPALDVHEPVDDAVPELRERRAAALAAHHLRGGPRERREFLKRRPQVRTLLGSREYADIRKRICRPVRVPGNTFTRYVGVRKRRTPRLSGSTHW